MCESVFLNFAYPPFNLNAFRTTGLRIISKLAKVVQAAVYSITIKLSTYNNAKYETTVF